MPEGIAPEALSSIAGLLNAVEQVLADSGEPLALTRIQANLPRPYHTIGMVELREVLQRQVTSGIWYQYPKYRGSQERYWDRNLTTHIADLLHKALAQGPLPWSALRRKLPTYAQAYAWGVLEAELDRGSLHCHPPPLGDQRQRRGRYGLQPPDPKDYLRAELPNLFQRFQRLGFTREQVRHTLVELLHEEEWGDGGLAGPHHRTPSPEITKRRLS